LISLIFTGGGFVRTPRATWREKKARFWEAT